VEVRVGTWNLENLFLPDGRFGPPPAVFEQKLDGLAGTIGRMAPDLLGVQEVGSPDALDQLVARLDGDWHVATSAHFEGRHPIRSGSCPGTRLRSSTIWRCFLPGWRRCRSATRAATARSAAPPRPAGARLRCGSNRPAAGACRWSAAI